MPILCLEFLFLDGKLVLTGLLKNNILSSNNVPDNNILNSQIQTQIQWIIVPNAQCKV